MNLILIPLNRFEVNFEVVKSEPYGEVHKLLLESIATRPATLEHLQELFQLPPRMLIEVLVSLFYDGWVTVTSEGFRLTPKGRTSLKENARPSNYLSVTDKTYLMMERISGGLIHKDDIAFDSKGGLRRRHLWEYATPMPIEYHDNRVDAAQAKLLIRERGGGWIRHIQTPAMTSGGEWHWLPVDVDPSKGEVIGLPTRWKTMLHDRLLAFADGLEADVVERRYWDNSTRQRGERKTKGMAGWPAELFAEDFISGAREHYERLRSALQTAKSTVLIVSSLLGTLPSDLRICVDEARARGITVDLFWGRKLKDEDFAPGFLLNTEPNNCRANLLVYDTDEGYTALVGSYAWLNVPEAGVVNTTVVLRHPGIVADICDSAAAIIESDDPDVTLSDVPLRWRDAARKLEAKAHAIQPTDGSSSVRVIRDQEHTAFFNEYGLTAMQRWGILCGRTDDAIRKLTVLSRRETKMQLEARVCVASESQADKENISAALNSFGVSLRIVPHLTASAVVADTSVLISGYSFLGLNDSRSHMFDVGVAIEGGPIADEVWKVTME